MSEVLTLERFTYAPWATHGRMWIDGKVVYTVERPWLDNAPSISCIPDGYYTCRPRRFFRGDYQAIEILNVPGRSHILFHIANWPEELEGCIAPVSKITGRGGSKSRFAFNHLMRYYGHQAFMLNIRPVMGTVYSTPRGIPDVVDR